LAFLLAACTPGTPSIDGQISGAQSRNAGADQLQIVKVLPPPPSTGAIGDVRISENDLLEIDVFQVNDLDRTVKVQSNGAISLPLIGEVKAAGLTLVELEAVLKRRYSQKYLQNPEISVFMKESAGQRVTMDGKFTKPGIYAIDSQTSLLQVVAQAGGLTELADEDKLYVYRTYPGGREVANYSVADIRAAKIRDPRIYGGDIVVAFSSSTKIARQNLKEALGVAVSATRIATPF